MHKAIVPVACVLTLFACSTGPSESTGGVASGIGNSLPDGGVPCACLACPKGATPQGGNPTSCDYYKCGLCPDPTSTLTMAPGQTDAGFVVEAGVDGWPDPAHVTFTMTGLPGAYFSVKFVQTSPYIPPVQGVAGAFEVSAVPATPRGWYPATITATSGSASQSMDLLVVVAGTCHPRTCAAGMCGTQDDGCSGKIACGGCAAGQYCAPNGTCASPNRCPSGTHDCGDGVCTKKPCL